MNRAEYEGNRVPYNYRVKLTDNSLPPSPQHKAKSFFFNNISLSCFQRAFAHCLKKALERIKVPFFIAVAYSDAWLLFNSLGRRNTYASRWVVIYFYILIDAASNWRGRFGNETIDFAFHWSIIYQLLFW